MKLISNACNLLSLLGWTHAFVTDVFEYNAHDPTIAELLMYWVGSAMQLPQTATIPDVSVGYTRWYAMLSHFYFNKYPEPVQNIVTPIRVPNQKVRINFGNVKGSESHWEGKSNGKSHYLFNPVGLIFISLKRRPLLQDSITWPEAISCPACQMTLILQAIRPNIMLHCERV